MPWVTSKSDPTGRTKEWMEPLGREVPSVRVRTFGIPPSHKVWNGQEWVAPGLVSRTAVPQSDEPSDEDVRTTLARVRRRGGDGVAKRKCGCQGG
jgi:hypothetical protein